MKCNTQTPDQRQKTSKQASLYTFIHMNPVSESGNVLVSAPSGSLWRKRHSDCCPTGSLDQNRLKCRRQGAASPSENLARSVSEASTCDRQQRSRGNTSPTGGFPRSSRLFTAPSARNQYEIRIIRLFYTTLCKTISLVICSR